MARHSLSALIRFTAEPRTDGDDSGLLRQFVEASDPAAFGELVRRYARLVWGQCRGLLANDPDADDAFQATFLALAKNAPSIRDSDRLGPWLHRVAYRVCLNARRAAARRRKRERGAAANEGATPVADSAWAAAEAALHEEVCRLPDALRQPFVLCGLEGRRPTDAARQLGLSWGTFSARLTRAKRRLLGRLAARGFGSGAVVGAALLPPTVSAAVVDRAVVFGSTRASVPASVLSLSSGVGVMGWTRSKWVALLGMTVAGVTALFAPAGRAPLAPTAHATPSAPAAPVPKEDPAVKRKSLEELWALLLVQDEATGSRALLELAARPKKDVVAFLGEKLKPLKLSGERAKKLLAELGDMKGETAKAAFEELCYFDPRLVLDVGDMLKDLPAGQHRQRVAALLVGANDLNGYAGCTIEYQSAEVMTARIGEKMCANFQIEDLNKVRAGGFARYSTGVAETVAELSRWQWHKEWGRATRAVMVLEHLGTPDAVKVLETMAGGHPDASPTKAAKAALERLKNNR